MLKRAFMRGLGILDGAASALSPGIIPESPSLITILFHSIYDNKAEAGNGSLDPQQWVTREHFRIFVETFLESGYSFISPADLTAGLEGRGKCMMITFDDGYYNNLRALDVLSGFKVPATFFISTNHVLQGKSFWWDAAYRGMAAAGLSQGEKTARMRAFKGKKNQEIEAALKSAYGEKALRPIGDADRPMTPEELRDFSRAPFVHLGNHTCDHAILTNYSREEMGFQIRECQKALAGITGKAPDIIAYPNGNHSQEVVQAALGEGLKTGITLVPRRNPLRSGGPMERMTLGRFILWGDRDIAPQCRVFRSGIAPGHFLKRILKKGY